MGAGDTVSLPFQLGTLARLKTESFTIELRRPRHLPSLAVSLTNANKVSLQKLFSRFDEGETDDKTLMQLILRRTRQPGAGSVSYVARL